MNFRRNSPDDQPEINLVPLIDVLLVILVFLAATTTFSRVHELDVRLPSAEATPAHTDVINLAISRDGLYALDGQLLEASSAAEIAQSLAEISAEHPQTALMINADAQAQHQAVVRVLEAANLAGLEDIRFAAHAEQP